MEMPKTVMARTSFGKQEPHLTQLAENLFQYVGHSQFLGNPSISAPISSARCAISLIKLILVAKKRWRHIWLTPQSARHDKLLAREECI